MLAHSFKIISREVFKGVYESNLKQGMGSLSFMDNLESFSNDRLDLPFGPSTSSEYYKLFFIVYVWLGST